MNGNNNANIAAGLENVRQQALKIQESIKGGITPSTSATTQGTQGNALLTELTSRLEKQSGASSSAQTELTRSINSAMKTAKVAGEQNAIATESAFNREIGYAREDATARKTSVLEGQSGFAMNQAMLQQLDQRTEKSLRDLEQRKIEALASGKAQTAQQIESLQLKAIEYRQTAEQQAFSNLLGATQVAVQVSAQEQAAKQFRENLSVQKMQLDFNERSEMAKLATEFGVTIEKTDTLSSIVSKVAPYASQMRRAQLANLQEGSTKKNMDLQLDSIMAQYIQEGASAEYAALGAANVYRTMTGNDPSQEQVQVATTRAMELKNKYDVAADQARAEAEGKSVENLFSAFLSRVNNGGSSGQSPYVTNNKFNPSPYATNNKFNPFAGTKLDGAKSADPVETFYKGLLGN